MGLGTFKDLGLTKVKINCRSFTKVVDNEAAQLTGEEGGGEVGKTDKAKDSLQPQGDPQTDGAAQNELQPFGRHGESGIHQSHQ